MERYVELAEKNKEMHTIISLLRDCKCHLSLLTSLRFKDFII